MRAQYFFDFFHLHLRCGGGGRQRDDIICWFQKKMGCWGCCWEWGFWTQKRKIGSGRKHTGIPRNGK